MRERKKPSPYQEFASLSNAEKEAVYRKLDDPDVARTAKSLSPKMRTLWNRAKRKGGRPRIGRGAKRVLLSIERGLLDEADALARRQNMSRSELFSRGVKAMLAMAG